MKKLPFKQLKVLSFRPRFFENLEAPCWRTLVGPASVNGIVKTSRRVIRTRSSHRTIVISRVETMPIPRHTLSSPALNSSLLFRSLADWTLIRLPISSRPRMERNSFLKIRSVNRKLFVNYFITNIPLFILLCEINFKQWSNYLELEPQTA